MSDTTCVRCGGVLEVSARWSCKYCGAAQPLPDGVVALTDDGVLGVLRQHLAGAASTSLAPTIPPKKSEGVRKTHAAYLPPTETLLGVYDGTVFGSATEGFFVTAKRLGFKNQMESANFLEWANIDPDSVYLDDSTVVVGPARIETVDEEEALWGWVQVIQQLARSARPAGVATTAARSAGAPAPAPDAWEGVASSWPAVPPTYGGELVERLARKPYDDAATSCSIVDVEPSGQLFVACGNGTVDLRYAANGARMTSFAAPDSICAARFSPDGRTLAVGGLDNKVTRYEIPTGRILGVTPEMGDTVDEIVWLGNTGRFAMGTQRGEVWIVDAAPNKALVTVLDPDPEYNHLGGICATADGAVLFVSIGERLGAFDAQTGKILWRFDGALTSGGRLTVSPRGDVLAAAGHFGLALFDARTGQPGARYPLSQASGVSWPEGGGLLRSGEVSQFSWSARPRFSPTGDAIAVQDPVGNLVLIDTTNFAPFVMPRDRGRAWIEDLAWFGDGNHVLVGMSDSSVAIWRVRPMTPLMLTAAFS